VNQVHELGFVKYICLKKHALPAILFLLHLMEKLQLWSLKRKAYKINTNIGMGATISGKHSREISTHLAIRPAQAPQNAPCIPVKLLG
jgi:hypothetical protein